MKALLSQIRRDPAETKRASGAARLRVTIGDSYKRIYAIGDIHGCYDQLMAVEDRIRADAAGREDERPLIIYLGDYVDRGPKSSAVVEHIATRDHGDGLARLALCGNHEKVFLRFLRDPENNASWLGFGGAATLLSYGLGGYSNPRTTAELREVRKHLLDAVPAHHISCLEQLPALAMQGRCVYVHAGIRPGVPLDKQSEQDLFWIREPFLTEGPKLPVTVIHGHTAGVDPVFGKGRVCIDTGCYATGRLTALRITPRGGAFV